MGKRRPRERPPFDFKTADLRTYRMVGQKTAGMQVATPDGEVVIPFEQDADAEDFIRKEKQRRNKEQIRDGL